MVPSAVHALQKFDITLWSPSLEGSLIAVCTCASSDALLLALLVAVFCARYWTSRNWSRMRLMSWIETPVPSWVPPPCWVSAGIVIAPLSTMFTRWRV